MTDGSAGVRSGHGKKQQIQLQVAWEAGVYGGPTEVAQVSMLG